MWWVERDHQERFKSVMQTGSWWIGERDEGLRGCNSGWNTLNEYFIGSKMPRWERWVEIKSSTTN